MRKIISLLNCSWFANQLIIETKNKINLTLLRIKTLGNINSFQSNSLFIKELNFKPMLLFIGVLVIANGGYAQNQNIRFEYDTAGNQITRLCCFSCAAKTPYSTKNISDLNESDMQKFNVDDNFSFYPNPVKEELYLKWDNSSQIKLQTINLYNINGALLKSYENQLSKDSNNILFQEYPNGVYIIGLIYTNGEEKTIKIIKQ